jgi:hypothetical protein
MVNGEWLIVNVGNRFANRRSINARLTIYDFARLAQGALELRGKRTQTNSLRYNDRNFGPNAAV